MNGNENKERDDSDEFRCIIFQYGYVIWLLDAVKEIGHTELLSLRLVSRDMKTLLLNSMNFGPLCVYEKIREKEEQLVSPYKITMTELFLIGKIDHPLYKIFDLLMLEENNQFTMKFELLIKYRFMKNYYLRPDFNTILDRPRTNELHYDKWKQSFKGTWKLMPNGDVVLNFVGSIPEIKDKPKLIGTTTIHHLANLERKTRCLIYGNLCITRLSPEQLHSLESTLCEDLAEKQKKQKKKKIMKAVKVTAFCPVVTFLVIQTSLLLALTLPIVIPCKFGYEVFKKCV
jgi:hypothetical protein